MADRRNLWRAAAIAAALTMAAAPAGAASGADPYTDADEEAAAATLDFSWVAGAGFPVTDDFRLHLKTGPVLPRLGPIIPEQNRVIPGIDRRFEYEVNQPG